MLFFFLKDVKMSIIVNPIWMALKEVLKHFPSPLLFSTVIVLCKYFEFCRLLGD